MLALTSILTVALLALPQDGAKSVPATPIKPNEATAPVAAKPEVKKLGVGDAAPALQYDQWIKGDKIEGITRGKVKQGKDDKADEEQSGNGGEDPPNKISAHKLPAV